MKNAEGICRVPSPLEVKRWFIKTKIKISWSYFICYRKRHFWGGKIYQWLKMELQYCFKIAFGNWQKKIHPRRASVQELRSCIGSSLGWHAASDSGSNRWFSRGRQWHAIFRKRGQVHPITADNVRGFPNHWDKARSPGPRRGSRPPRHAGPEDLARLGSSETRPL